MLFANQIWWIVLNCCFPENAAVHLYCYSVLPPSQMTMTFQQAKAATLIFLYKSNTSCALPWSPIQSFPRQPTSEWVSEDCSVTPPLQHTSHVTWKCLTWWELQISHSPLSTSKILTKDALCVCVLRWERAWTGMDQGQHVETQWTSSCGTLQTTRKGRCLQELFGGRAGPTTGRGVELWMEQDWAGLPGAAEVHI